MFHCDMGFDPFAYLQNNNKTYGELGALVTHILADTVVLEGFNIAVYEWMETIPSLWSTVKGVSSLIAIGYLGILTSIL